MKNRFEVSYMTTLPKEGNAPRVSIFGNIPQKYNVRFYEFNPNEYKLIFEGNCETNQILIPKSKQWFTNWIIEIRDEAGEMVFKDVFDIQDETIFVKMDAWALGDTLAWIPYVEEFRKKNMCGVICSTFYNELLVRAYPNIMFVKPNTTIHNVYAQYYIGASNDDNQCYSPIKVNEHPLQEVASAILGLEYKELRPDLKTQYLHKERRIKDKYICLSEFGSDEKKNWKAENGWQAIVDYLNSKGYKVLVISREPTQLKNIIDLTGNISLEERLIDLMYCEYYIGVSSGLAWLAWSVGAKCVMISDGTPQFHEFQSDMTRICANDLTEVNWGYSNITSPIKVLKKLEEMGL